MNSYPKTSRQKYKFTAIFSAAIMAAMVILSLFVLSNSVSAADIADVSVSTYDELRLAVNGAPAGGTPYTIEVTADITMAGTLTVTAGKNVVLRSDVYNTWTITSLAPTLPTSSSLPRHFTVVGTLTLENIILDGDSLSGGVNVNTATSVFYLNGGAVIQNCKSRTAAEGGGISITSGGTATVNGGKILFNQKPMTNGGGGVYMNRGTFTMNGGEVCNNKAGDKNSSTSSAYSGGGISAFYSTITINGGKINDNEAAQNGGGISLGQDTVFVMEGGEITGNAISAYSSCYGGGIYIGHDTVTVSISGVTISNNTSKNDGGGICIRKQPTGGTFVNGALGISDSNISGNVVKGGNGGGICTVRAITIDNCIVIGNTASGGTGCGNGGGLHYSYADVPLEIGGGIFSGNVAETTATSSGSGSGGAISGGGTLRLSGNVVIGGDTPGEGNKADQYGGGIFIGNGTLEIGDTVKISCNTANDGGGIACNGSNATSFSTVNIGDSVEISNNRAAKRGGGVMSNCGTGTSSPPNIITIAENAKVADNTAGTLGGGVFVYSGGSVNVTGDVCGNMAGTAGGGIYGSTNTSVTVNGGKITGNSSINGGGIYGSVATSIIISSSKISGNIASADGGGIFTEETQYKNLATEYPNLDTSGDTVFSSNSAAVTYLPPDSAATLYPKILFAEVSATTHPLNNDDINYKSTEAPKYFVTYNANGGTGSNFNGQEIKQGGKDVVLHLADAGIAYAGHDFAGWNTKSDGTGITYASNDTIILTGNIELYAQWISNVVPPIVQQLPDPVPVPGSEPELTDESDPEAEDEPEADAETEPESETGAEAEISPEPGSEPAPNPRPAPGGTNPEIPPVAINLANTLVPTDDGGYIEIDEEGVPLGEWHWEDEPEMWIFDEYPPLGSLPQTGGYSPEMNQLLLLAGFSLLGVGVTFKNRKFYKPKRLK